MIDASVNAESSLPSFSLIIETENLANADITHLSESLNSIANQDIAINDAQDVVIIDSGDTPKNILENIRTRYPWIQIHRVTTSVDYYDVKMQGVNFVTGDIVVYADSDCVYETNWLRDILTTFAQNAEINVVAGETSLAITGFYELAMAITYFLPRFSQRETPYVTTSYFLNNVAFRRDFLKRYPIPTGIPLYRGNCAIHAEYLREQGFEIWKQPNAQAKHAPPEGISFFIWRFLLMGHDRLLRPYIQQKLFTDCQLEQPRARSQFEQFLQLLIDDTLEWLAKTKAAILEEPTRLALIPLALPIIMFSKALFYVGYIITLFNSDYLLTAHNKSQL